MFRLYTLNCLVVSHLSPYQAAVWQGLSSGQAALSATLPLSSLSPLGSFLLGQKCHQDGLANISTQGHGPQQHAVSTKEAPSTQSVLVTLQKGSSPSPPQQGFSHCLRSPSFSLCTNMVKSQVQEKFIPLGNPKTLHFFRS